MERLAVQKTYKLFINGQFTRSESGRYIPLDTNQGTVNLCRASRKDFRNAVQIARPALATWSGYSALLRGQILYRISEMMEARRNDLMDRLTELPDLKESDPTKELNAAIDHVLWYAGWTDKYAALCGTVNPVTGPYFTFSYPEPMGIVGIVAPQNSPLCGLVNVLMLAMLSGNVSVVLADQRFGAVAITLSEIIATSDVPPGVVNMLTGDRSELLPHFYSHMDVNAIIHPDRYEELSQEEIMNLFKAEGHNLKRCPQLAQKSELEWQSEPYGPIDFSKLTETKTVWHPAAMP